MQSLFLILIFLSVLVLYTGIHVYICRHLFLWSKTFLKEVKGRAFALFYSVFPLLLFSGFLPFPENIQPIFDTLSAYTMGFFAYLFAFFVLSDILKLLLKAFRLSLMNKFTFYNGLVVFSLTIGVTLYGIYNATNIYEVSYEVDLEKETDLHIVLISDLHIGAVGSEKRLEEMVKKMNKSKPDLILMAGDIFNDDFHAIQDPERVAGLFRSLKSTYGVYASLGNHDSGNTFDGMTKLLEESHITLLTDSYAVAGEEINIIGRLDASPIGGYGNLKRSDVSSLFDELDLQLPVIVLDHTPRHLEEYDEKTDLILSGHTHKGQLFPGELITNLLFEVDYGLYQRDKNSPHVIVSSGVGTWGMPMRVGTQNEIVHIYVK